MVGELLDKLDELGIADNTIVMYSTDNGAEVMSWPDGGTTPFRGEKNTNWEGGYRVPCADPLAGRDQAGHGLQRHLRARGLAADAPGRGRATRTSSEKLLDGLAGRREDLQGPPRRLQPDALPEGRHRRAAAQGVPLLDRRRRPGGPALQPAGSSIFLEQRAAGLRRLAGAVRRAAGAQAVQPARDPFERADHEGIGYPRWRIDRVFCWCRRRRTSGSGCRASSSSRPGRRPASFGIDQVMRQITQGPSTSD